MNSKCFFQTDGYRIFFELKNRENIKHYVDIVVGFQLIPELGDVSIKSVSTQISLNDLQRLATYFEQHIDRLGQDPDSESDIFVPMELGFQFQALSGEIRSQSDGEFDLRFMVSLGVSNQGSRVYAGGESVATLRSVLDFISSIHSCLTALSYST